MTTSKKPAFVQLQANCMVDGCVEPAQHRGEVEFYSIYLGEPGNYQWVADFEGDVLALRALRYLELAFDCEVDRSQYDAVMDTPAPEPKPNGHPHAALMAEYAKDAAETDKPWERWEYQDQGCITWHAVAGHPYWTTNARYRRKPKPPKTITVNGFEVPAPIDKAPHAGDVYWVPYPLGKTLCMASTYKDACDRVRFERGLIHANKEAAVAHAKAMLGIDPKADA